MLIFGGILVEPKFLGKLGLKIGVYQKAPPKGGTFGGVPESTPFAVRATAASVNGRLLELNLTMHPTHTNPVHEPIVPERHRDSETSPKLPPMGGVLVGKPYLQT